MKKGKIGIWLAGMAGWMILWHAVPVLAQEPVRMPVAEGQQTAVTLETGEEQLLTPTGPDAVMAKMQETEAQAQEADAGLILMRTAAAVNVRTAPSSRSSRLGTLPAGEQVIAAENADGWFAVVWQDQVGYVNGKYLQPAAEPADGAGQENPGEAVGEQQAQLPGQEGIWPGAPLVFIGDSRFVQMKEAVDPTPWVWIAESGKGYDWFVEKGLSRADNVIGTNSRVIINLGVNDVRNADKYIALFNRKAAEWTARGARVYYASVNPVWTNPYVSREQVEAFNLKLQTSLNLWITWVDSYSYLQTVGCRIVDGLHYDTPGYQVIYAYYMEMCP